MLFVLCILICIVLCVFYALIFDVVMVYMILIILIHSTYCILYSSATVHHAYCTRVWYHIVWYMIPGTLYDTVTDVLNMNGNKLIKVKKVQYRSRRQRQKCYHWLSYCSTTVVVYDIVYVSVRYDMIRVHTRRSQLFKSHALQTKLISGYCDNEQWGKGG